MAVGYKYPNVDFSWLGELPQIADEASTRNARKQALAGLDSSDSASLEKTAASLLRAGDLEGATKLFGIVQSRNALAQKGSADETYNKVILPMIMQGKFGMGGGAAGGAAAAPSGSYSPPAPDTGPAPAGAPAGLRPWPTSQAAPPPPVASATPPPVAAVGMAPLGPPDTSAPEDQPPNQQVAQAGPPVAPPQTVPPGPVPGRPPPVPGQPPAGFNPNMTVLPGTLPEAPAPRPAPRLVGPGQDPADIAAADKAYKDAILAGSSKGTPPGVRSATMAALNSALEKLKITPEERNYHVDQAQRQGLGLPAVSMTDWQKGKQGYGPLLDELIKTDADIQKRGNKSTDVLQSLNTLDTIAKSPDFQSGKSQALVNKGVSLAYTLAGVAKNLGVPDQYIPSLDDMKSASTARLGEMFSGLSNQLIFNALGGLGAQISNSDRNFVSDSFPNLNLTPQGNKLLIKYLQGQYSQDKAAAAVARSYRKEYGVNADAPGLIDAVQKYRDDHPLIVDKEGKFTDLGKEMQGAIGANKSIYDVTAAPGTPGRLGLEAAGRVVQRGAQDVMQQAPGAFTGPSPTGGYLPGVEAVRSGIQAVGSGLRSGAETVDRAGTSGVEAAKSGAQAVGSGAQAVGRAVAAPFQGVPDPQSAGLIGTRFRSDLEDAKNLVRDIGAIGAKIKNVGTGDQDADYTDVLRQHPLGSHIIRSRGKLYVRRPNGDRIPME